MADGHMNENICAFLRNQINSISSFQAIIYFILTIKMKYLVHILSGRKFNLFRWGGGGGGGNAF